MWVSESVPADSRSAWTTSASSNRCGARTRGTAARCWRLHTGSDTFVRPGMGSWITYGLGTENQNMPGYHHHLPDAEPRRREQLQLRISAGAVRGHADRLGGDQGARRAAFLTSRTRRRPRHPAHGTRLRAGAESRATQADRAGRGAGRPHRVVRAGLPDAGGSAGICRTSPENRRPRRSCTGWTTASRRTSAASA